VDRGRSGSKIHVLTDRAGLPLSVAVSAANTNDSYALKPLVKAIPAIKSRRGPRRRKPAKLHADKAYDHADLRGWVRDQGTAVRIAGKGIESAAKLGKHRWVIERSMAWPFGYRRLSIRYERKATHFSGCLTLAAILTCFKNSPNETRTKLLAEAVCVLLETWFYRVNMISRTVRLSKRWKS
jgi:transposase